MTNNWSRETGSFMLNRSIVGYPTNAITEIYGAKGMGKTALALAAATRSKTLYMDCERTLTPALLNSYGLDDMDLQFPLCGEEWYDSIIDNIGKYELIVIDQLDNIVPRSSLEFRHSEGTQARFLAVALKNILKEVVGSNTALLATTRVLKKGFTGGGNYLKSAASIRLFLSKGVDYIVRPTRTMSGPKLPKPAYYKGRVFDFGMDELMYRLSIGEVSKSGSFYSMKDKIFGRSKREAADFFGIRRIQHLKI